MKKYLLLFLLLWGLAGCAPSDIGPAPPSDGFVIAILDTGISTAAVDRTRILPGYNYVLPSEDTEDRINHGTAVASVLAGCESAEVVGLATEAHLVPLVICDKVGGEVVSVSPGVLAQAIRDSVDKYAASVINVSLGIKEDDGALRDAVAYVQERGALVIAAAGNEGESTELYYPAAYEGVLTVGSHDKNMEISDFTQRNGTVDILAPGEDIWLASRNGKTYGTRGTSYATAYVSAAAANLWQEKPELSVGELQESLISSAHIVDGWHILNLEACHADDN